MPNHRPQHLFFVVEQTTTRPPCVHMAPWPIFQPMILAYVVTGGNRKDGVRDLVMALCCALPNFRVRLTPWQPMV